MTAAKTWRPWTPEEDALLRELHAAGLTYNEIAASIGRLSNSVKTRVENLSLPRRRRLVTEHEFRLLKEAWERGDSTDEICRLLGRSRNFLHEHINRLGLKRRTSAHRPPPPPAAIRFEDEAEARAMYASGRSIPYIAEWLGWTRREVEQVVLQPTTPAPVTTASAQGCQQ